VELAGLSGSAWQGRAEQAAVAAVPLGALNWSLDKAPLLGGVLHEVVASSSPATSHAAFI